MANKMEEKHERTIAIIMLMLLMVWGVRIFLVHPYQAWQRIRHFDDNGVGRSVVAPEGYEYIGSARIDNRVEVK